MKGIDEDLGRIVDWSMNVETRLNNLDRWLGAADPEGMPNASILQRIGALESRVSRIEEAIKRMDDDIMAISGSFGSERKRIARLERRAGLKW